MKLSKVLAISGIISMLALTACGGGSSSTGADAKKGEAKKSDFPKKEITIVVPWNAGGGNDLMARKLQTVLKEEMGVSAVVKNSPGGNGVVGIQEVLNSKPDGYTLGVNTSSTLSVMALGKASIAPEKLSNIAQISEDPLVMVVKADAKWKDAKDFVEYMKANPTKATIATPGTNNVNHAIAAMLGSTTGTQFQHVPFDGGALVITQLLGGHVDAAILKPSESMAQIKEGKLKAIAINADKRVDTLPDVKTFKESGIELFKNGDVKQISFIVGPAGMDAATHDKLVELFDKAVKSEAYQKFAKDGAFITPSMTGKDLDKNVEVQLKSLSDAFTKIFK